MSVIRPVWPTYRTYILLAISPSRVLLVAAVALLPHPLCIQREIISMDGLKEARHWQTRWWMMAEVEDHLPNHHLKLNDNSMQTILKCLQFSFGMYVSHQHVCDWDYHNCFCTHHLNPLKAMNPALIRPWLGRRWNEEKVQTHLIFLHIFNSVAYLYSRSFLNIG